MLLESLENLDDIVFFSRHVLPVQRHQQQQQQQQRHGYEPRPYRLPHEDHLEEVHLAVLHLRRTDPFPRDPLLGELTIDSAEPLKSYLALHNFNATMGKDANSDKGVIIHQVALTVQDDKILSCLYKSTFKTFKLFQAN